MAIADSDGDVLHFYHLVPIGSVVAWLKDYTNTPALPEGWVECDGSAISDAESPYNGQNAPDLNSSIGDSNKGRFLRGHSSSGDLEDSQNLTHLHTVPAASESAGGGRFELGATGTGTLNTGSTGDTEARPFNYSVVWIFRIK